MLNIDKEKDVRQGTLYSELFKHVHSNDFEKAIKSCNRLLHERPDDEFAFECKITCCVNLTRFDDALEYAKKNPGMTKNLHYELAYCHYRLNQTEEALKLLEKITDTKDTRKKELYVQILYRLERYVECHELYKEVCKTTSDSYDDERLCNLSAIVASCRGVNAGRKMIVDKGTTFEQKYNYATYLVAEGKFDLAEKVLLEAEQTCEEVFRDEGAAEEDIQDELCIMRALRGFCCQKLGREKEAMRLYTAILKVKPTDIGVLAVVSNNMVVLNRDQNIFDSKKRLKAMKVDTIGYKLTNAQKLSIQLNTCLFYLLTNQDELCQELCTSLLNGIGKNSDDAYCLAACHNFRSAKSKSINPKEEESVVASRPELDLKIKLGVIKMSLEKGDIDSAITSADKLAQDHGYPLGLISALVVILRQYKSKEEVSLLLEAAVKHFEDAKKDERAKRLLPPLLKQAASFEMEIGEYKKADQLLRKLLESHPNDILGIALLLTVYIHVGDKKIIEGLRANLPDPDGEGFDVDAAESDSLGSIKYVKKSARSGTGDPLTPVPSAPTTRAHSLKKNKKKKSKLPKNYDPNRSVDPERWMPRFLRSGYKPKKVRRGRADVGKGTQGVSSEAAEVYDMSRNTSASKTPGNETPQQKKTQKGRKK